MAKLKFNSAGVAGARKHATSAKNTSASVKDGVASIQKNMQSCVTGRSNIFSRLTNVKSNLSQVETGIAAIYQMVDNASIKYINTETNVVKLGQAVAQSAKISTLSGNNNRAFATTKVEANKKPGSVANKGKVTSNYFNIPGAGFSSTENPDLSKSIFGSKGLFDSNTNTGKYEGTLFDMDTINRPQMGNTTTVEKAEGNQDKEHSGFAKFVGNDLKVSGSVLYGDIDGAGELWGVNTVGKLSGSILTGEAGIESNFSLGFEDGKWDVEKFGFTTTAQATGALAKGTAEGNFGYLHGEVTGQALTGAVKGEAKMQIFEDGKLNPSLMVAAKAEGSVLKGEAEAGFGTDQYGIYAKAAGDVLHAEAEAAAGLGYIGTDEDGKAQYGAKAEASAMASIAQGEVKGGFTLFGVDVDIGAKGYAGAVGVEAGASVTTEGVTAKLSGAAALGVGLEVSVDWSDAEWIEDGIDWVGDSVEDAGEFLYDTGLWIGDKAEDVGDFLFGWI